MTGTTTGQTSLATATDSDDTETFLTGPLTTDLQALANLFESATGHDHSGAGKGKPIASAGIASGVTLTDPVISGSIHSPASTDLILSPGAGGVVRPNLNYAAVNSSANTAVAAGTTVDLNPGLLFTLAAGTWLLLGHWVALDTSAAANLMTGYIRDGANTVIATHTNTAVASGYGGGPLLAVVTPAVSTGYKISVNATGNATAQSGTSSGLIAIRLA